MTEQQVIDWLADRFSELIQEHGIGTLAAPEFAHHVSRMMYFASGKHFDVRLAPAPIPDMMEGEGAK